MPSAPDLAAPITPAPRAWVAPVARVALAVLVLRVLFLGILFPAELTGDEAHYWDWSRHLQWSYHTKGPGIAWLIGLGTWLCGDTELGVRLFAYLSDAVGIFGCGALGAALSRGSVRCAMWSALGYAAVGAYQAAGSVMTIDAPMLACWISGTAVAVTAWNRCMDGRPFAGAAGLAGAVFGFGFLCKYTAGLPALGLLIGAIRLRHALPDGPGKVRALSLFVGGSLLGTLPVLGWNAANDWPTVTHLLGHMSLDANALKNPDRPTWTPLWTLGFFGLLVAVPGPFVALGLARGGQRAWTVGTSAERLCLWAGLPVVAMYFFVSFLTETEGNWPIGVYGCLVPLGVRWLMQTETREARIVRRGVAWRGGVTLGLILVAMPLAQGVDWAAKSLERRSPVRRILGNRDFALGVRELAREALGDAVDETTLVVNYYDRTGLLGFYLDSNPSVRCACYALTNRQSAYDNFDDTVFPHPSEEGRTVVLIGARPEEWQHEFRFDDWRQIGQVQQQGRTRRVFVATYLGRQ